MARIWPDHKTIQRTIAEIGPVAAWSLMQRRLFNDAVDRLRALGFEETPSVRAELANARLETKRWAILARAASESAVTDTPAGRQAAVTLLGITLIASSAELAKEAAIPQEKDAHWSWVALGLANLVNGRLQHAQAGGDLWKALRKAQSASVAIRTLWRASALEHCRRRRNELPHLPTSKLADEVAELNVGAPSSGQIRKTINVWEKSGELPRRKLAGEGKRRTL
jgi:hypothetical protein